jgi:hypothetical protein
MKRLRHLPTVCGRADTCRPIAALLSPDAASSTTRARLTEQLSKVLQTRDTAQGLIVSMSDVLFETGKYELNAEAREKLAKVAGILLAYPGLNIAVGGYTDNVGGDQMNRSFLFGPKTGVWLPDHWGGPVQAVFHLAHAHAVQFCTHPAPTNQSSKWRYFALVSVPSAFSQWMSSSSQS